VENFVLWWALSGLVPLVIIFAFTRSIWINCFVYALLFSPLCLGLGFGPLPIFLNSVSLQFFGDTPLLHPLVLVMCAQVALWTVVVSIPLWFIKVEMLCRAQQQSSIAPASRALLRVTIPTVLLGGVLPLMKEGSPWISTVFYCLYFPFQIVLYTILIISGALFLYTAHKRSWNTNAIISLILASAAFIYFVKRY
jgi:hypothetical protein